MPIFRFLVFTLVITSYHAAALEWHGLTQLRLTNAENPESWLQGGSGLYQYDQGNNGLNLGQTLLSVRQDLSTSWSAHGVGHINSGPDYSAGFSQAFLRYKPLSVNRYEWQVDVGAFYPAMSLENPDIGWSSPYLYTNSAINSWLGEEVRTVGLEASFSRPGRRFRSPHTFEWRAAVFMANDSAGSLLAWRGFAIHDRQSTLNESIPFADNPAFDNTPLQHQANNVIPFSEVDGRYGYYTGMHWDYYKRSQIRLYYYDNNGDPAALNYRTGQYAWDTRFFSAAWLFKITPRTRIVIQGLHGNTKMGPNNGVDNDFEAFFILLSHQWGQHRISARYDYFSVIELDDWAFDPNDSDGESIALSWRYDIDKHWQVGGEVTHLDSFVENRALWWETQSNTQRLLQFNIQYRF
ncbi:MAG TPA: hypothetical protein VIC08_14330 [Cellvibrionaceae bacterium]